MNKLDKICEVHGLFLDKLAPWMDGEICLKALATVESSYGIYNIPRHEKAYDLGGIYSKSYKPLLIKYGAMAACSWSSFQIMYPVAYELGFQGDPIELQNDELAIMWVMEYIRKRILDKGCSRLQDFADAYNSGTFRDKLIPEDYITKFMKAYLDLHGAKYQPKEIV